MSLSFSNSGPSLVVQAPPVVKSVGHFVIAGKEIDATFDFTGLPVEYHHTLMQLILQTRTRISVFRNLAPAEPKSASSSRPWWKLW